MPWHLLQAPTPVEEHLGSSLSPSNITLRSLLLVLTVLDFSKPTAVGAASC